MAVLRGFERVSFTPGETQHVKIPLGPRDLSLWDNANHVRVVPSGTFRVGIASSAHSVHLVGALTVPSR